MGIPNREFPLGLGLKNIKNVNMFWGKRGKKDSLKAGLINNINNRDFGKKIRFWIWEKFGFVGKS